MYIYDTSELSLKALTNYCMIMHYLLRQYLLDHALLTQTLHAQALLAQGSVELFM